MELLSSAPIPDWVLASMTLLNEKPRLGVPSRKSAPHQSIDQRNCTAVLGLRFRCSETVSGTVVAPSNATLWYKNPCIQSALAKGAASTALDAVGLLPEGGAVSAAFSLWHGAAGVSNGTKILERVQFGAALISTANAGSDVSGSEGAFSLSGAQALTGAATIGAGLLKAAPVVGQVLSGISVAGDLYGTYKAVAGCHP
jgi:hypothetical protein